MFSDQRHANVALKPENIPITHLTKGWVGLWADLDGYGEEINSSSHRSSNPRPSQSVGSRYTEHAIPIPHY